MDNNQVSDNLLGYTPSPDAIQEFNLITNNASAEFGNYMGGVVSVTLKSGSNSFHGDVWEFFRNDKLNANQWENKINPSSPAIPRAPVRWNMYGGTLGGPVIKDKLFFFVDYQGQRFDHPPAGSFITVFTPAEQAGNFSALLNQTPGIQLYNPCAGTTGQNGTPCVAATTRTPFANNIIPASMISPVAAALFASPLYPKTINGNLTNNALQEISNQYNSDQGDVKIDYDLNSKNRLSGRFTRAYQNDPETNSQPLLANGLATAPIWSTVGDWTHTFTNVVNDARFGWNHVILNTGSTWDPSVGTFGESHRHREFEPRRRCWTSRHRPERRKRGRPGQRNLHQPRKQPRDAELQQHCVPGRRHRELDARAATTSSSAACSSTTRSRCSTRATAASSATSCSARTTRPRQRSTRRRILEAAARTSSSACRQRLVAA